MAVDIREVRWTVGKLEELADCLNLINNPDYYNLIKQLIKDSANLITRISREQVVVSPLAFNANISLIEVGQTSRGYKIYRTENGAGGHTYYSDAVGGGVVIYDSCLASREEVELALKIEDDFNSGRRV